MSATTGQGLPRMTADEFLAWAIELPKGQRYELVDGEVVGMAAERSVHALMKGRIYRRLSQAMGDARIEGAVYPDGMAVRIDAATVYEPDAQLRCGAPLPDDDIFVPDPVVVVEVLSPTTRGLDLAGKMDGYFSLPRLRHYLVVDIKRRVTIHHRRDGAGDIATRLRRNEPIDLDPPGIVIADPFDRPL